MNAQEIQLFLWFSHYKSENTNDQGKSLWELTFQLGFQTITKISVSV